ncbi:MAG TPA: GNAT family N-acetyltransferase [Candidatus Izemoplasmatales bacterium]|nr:GNAT family N-acetyltransferase [Candidatus Izemoplasmatales bacterium]
MTKSLIRKASIDDAEGRGYVHYQSWIETYTGLFPDERMKRLNLQSSINIAREHPENTYVALVGNKIVGFCSYMKSRDEDLADAGEIVAIYVLKEYQGQGIGKKLMDVCYRELKEYPRLSLWVLGSNDKAIRFYSSQGFAKDGKTKTIYDREAIRMVKNQM